MLSAVFKTKETKKAREDVRIASSKIDNYLDRLADTRRTQPEERDARICSDCGYPRGYQPPKSLDAAFKSASWFTKSDYGQ